ncbi:MAG: DUF4293 domain-containing protein [Rikenellaceae bacterium]|nr:DUF4293 domain-containing protein [Rikenellaceae bacterium]
MLQRIQSLYLLFAVILMAMMLGMPLGRFLEGDNEYIFRAFGIYSETSEVGGAVVPLPYLGYLLVITALVPLVTIFFYKNRLLQIRLCFMEFVLLAGSQIFVIFYLVRANTIDDGTVSYSLLDIVPLIALVFVWLAYKGIVRDEALVRSLDRIR